LIWRKAQGASCTGPRRQGADKTAPW
jgi:hypothetical protein